MQISISADRANMRIQLVLIFQYFISTIRIINDIL